MKLFLTLITSLALVATVRAEPDHKKKNKGEQPVQAQQQVVTPKQNKHQANQLQQQQHIQNKLNKHVENQGQHVEHKLNKENKHLENQDQHAMHQLNKEDKHAVNQEQHAEHKLNKEDKHLANQEQHQKHEIKKFETSKGWKKDVQSEQFVQGKHIKGSEKWQGKQYIVFKNYNSQWHDHDWWAFHHSNIILISGGYYYWDTGYWYPAWGYDPGYTYYPYDGPIYTGQASLPPDQMIANVQSALQEEGYYEGEVDGLLGPLTRAALASYQQDHGLYTTSAIDEPTLESLGMA